MGFPELNLSLGTATTTVPYRDLLTFDIKGVKGAFPASGKPLQSGFGSALQARWLLKELATGLSLTGGFQGGAALGSHYTSLFGSGFAGLRIMPSTGYSIDIDAGIGALQVNTETLGNLRGYGALAAVGIAGPLPQLCKGCQLGLRLDANLSFIADKLSQQCALLTFGYRFSETATQPAETAGANTNPTSPIDAAFQEIEGKLKLISGAYNTDLNACASILADVEEFFNWVSSNGDSPSECKLPKLAPEIEAVKQKLAAVKALIVGRPTWQARSDAAHADLLKLTPSLVQKGLELLMGPQGYLDRMIVTGKKVQDQIIRGEFKEAKDAVARYEGTLTNLKKIYDANIAKADPDVFSNYRRAEQVMNCLLTGIDCPTGIDTGISVPALKKKLGISKGK